MLGENDVKKIAKLALLLLSPEELLKYSGELSKILAQIDQMQSVDLSSVEPMSHVHGITNVFREDVVTHSLSIEDALSNAPDTSGRFIRVPIIIDQEG